MCKESYLIKNYINEYNYIVSYSLLNNLNHLPFPQRVYLCLNNLTHVPICEHPNCLNEVKFKNGKSGYRHHCSLRCSGSDPKVNNQKVEKSLLKYGTRTPQQNQLVKDKALLTNIDKYGHNSAMCLKETQEKRKVTCLEKYGVEFVGQVDEIIEKRVESFKKSNYKETYKNTCLERYGVTNPWKVKEIHNKSVKQTKDIKNSVTKNIIYERLSNYPNYKLINIEYLSMPIIEIECPNKHIFKIDRSKLYIRDLYNSEICTICNPIEKAVSGMEICLTNFIYGICDYEIIENSRKVINPYEIDIYLPEINLAIEFNGTYWHSSDKRENGYHKMKYDICKSKGIDLICIWEDDWILRQDIVKSFLIDKISKHDIEININDCVIEVIGKIESGEFYNDNYLHVDNCSYDLNIGLLYNGELVSLLSFTKDDDNYILDRFCNRKYNSVEGSFQKLIEYFIENYKTNIVLYSDNLIGNYKLYESSGFKFVKDVDPEYWYLNNKIRKLTGNDDQLKIYNGGSKKYIFNN